MRTNDVKLQKKTANLQENWANVILQLKTVILQFISGAPTA